MHTSLGVRRQMGAGVGAGAGICCRGCGGTGVSMVHTVLGSFSITVWVPVCTRVWVASGASSSTSSALRSGLHE